MLTKFAKNMNRLYGRRFCGGGGVSSSGLNLKTDHDH